MALWGLFFSAFIVGFSGALMPGPMLGVTIEGSLRRGFGAGPLVVLGHGLLELSLVFLLAFGLGDILVKPTVSGTIGLLGGAFLGWMGFDMVRASLKGTVSLENAQRRRAGRNLILAGIAVSLGNPYFILWWATTGLEFVRRALTLGILGLILFFAGHILSDLVWYSGVSLAFGRGRNFLGDKVYRGLIFLLGLFLLAFALYFIWSGWGML